MMTQEPGKTRILFPLLLFFIFMLPFVSIIILSSSDLFFAQDSIGVTGRSSWIGGRYFLSRRHNLAGATVKLDAEGGRDIYLTVTDESGRWNFKDVPEGKYRLELFKEGFLPIKKNDVTVQAPFKSVIELQGTPSKKAYGSVMNWSLEEPAKALSDDQTGSRSAAIQIRGKVVSKEGTPMADAEIVLKHVKGSIDPYRVNSDAEGVFRIGDVQAGMYDVSISAIAYFTVRFSHELKMDMDMNVIMIQQSQNYQYSPSELIPPEEPLPPSGQSSLQHRTLSSS